jgi:hypothetical protein
LILLLAVFAFCYRRVGFEGGAQLGRRVAVGYAVQVATFQKPEPKPATESGKELMTAEVILVPVQAALLLLAIRRKLRGRSWAALGLKLRFHAAELISLAQDCELEEILVNVNKKPRRLRLVHVEGKKETAMKIQRIVTTALLFAAALSLAWTSGDQPVVDWISTHAVRLQTPEAGHGFADMQALKKTIGGARIVSLGEATHMQTPGVAAGIVGDFVAGNDSDYTAPVHQAIDQAKNARPSGPSFGVGFRSSIHA